MCTSLLSSACGDANDPLEATETVERVEDAVFVPPIVGGPSIPPGGAPRAADGLPLLHSLPGAPSAIYLDFREGVYIPRGATHAGYNASGSDPSTFDAAEQDAIIATWQKVSVIFSMFNINVSTDPDVQGQRVWILISSDVPSGGAGSYGSFPDNDGAHARINASSMRSFYVNGIVHEITHNLGSDHSVSYDEWGGKLETYMSARDPLHGPTMGGGGGAVTKWVLWHGEGGVTSLNDQIADIERKLSRFGAAYRRDDGSEEEGEELPLRALTNAEVQARRIGVPGTLVGAGRIETIDDSDFFVFTPPATGNYTVSVARQSPSGVDVGVALYTATSPLQLIARHDGDPRRLPYETVNDEFLSPVALTAGQRYLIQVMGHGNYADIGEYVVRVDPLPNGLNPGTTSPAKWRSRDIGLNAPAGFAAFGSSNIVLQGGGADLANATNDAIHFVSQPLAGDGSITVRVDDVPGSTAFAQAGLMIRETLAPDASHFSVVATRADGNQMIHRATRGAVATPVKQNAGVSFTTPVWLRLTRAGSTFTAATATSGSGPWTTVGTRTMTMGTKAHIGVLSTGNYYYFGDSGKPALLSNLSTTGNVNPQPNVSASLLVPALSVDSAWVRAHSARLTWTSVGTATDGYALERSADGINFEEILTTTALSRTDSPGVETASCHMYRVRSRAGSQVSGPSNVVNACTRPDEVSDLAVSHVPGEEHTSLTLDWTDASYEAGYRVERSTSSSGPWVQVGSDLPRNTPTFTDTGLSADTTYWYRVQTLPAVTDNVSTRVSRRTQRPLDLFVLQDGILNSVNYVSGDYTKLTEVWQDSTSMALCWGELFIIQNSGLHAVSTTDGSWNRIGPLVWEGPTEMTCSDDALFIIQNNRLNKVNRTDGSWVSVGPAGWNGATSMTTPTDAAGSGRPFYAIQADFLHEVTTAGGIRLLGSGVWTGPTEMGWVGPASTGSLYIVQGDRLYVADPSTGARTQRSTTNWAGTKAMTTVAGYADMLFIIQGNRMYKVTPTTGARTAVGGTIWGGTGTLMAASRRVP